MHLAFCATAKSGVGHVRRLTQVAVALRQAEPEARIDLLVNAPVDGVLSSEEGVYRQVKVVPRSEMAAVLAALGPDAVLVDTAVIPDLHTVPARRCLLLREVRDTFLPRFALANGAAWDLVLVPHPQDEWRPDGDVLPAHRVSSVGWIYRAPAPVPPWGSDGVPHVLVSSGGGGNAETRTQFRALVEPLLAGVRTACGKEVEILQNRGPRATGEALLAGVDRAVNAGPNLPRHFAGADVVISTAGYNSVLELAATDVPTLLVAIPRRYDDQEARARRWGERLGHALIAGNEDQAARWLTRTLKRNVRRTPMALPSSGATCAAQAMAGLLAEAGS